MEDISLHLLDVIENSIRAGAKRIDLSLRETAEEKILVITIEDDGCGMDSSALRNPLDPFFTTKEGKKTGLGLPLFAQSAEETGGGVKIQTARNCGTKVVATFYPEHPDMRPIGDLASTLETVLTAHPEIRFVCDYDIQGEKFSLDSDRMKL